MIKPIFQCFYAVGWVTGRVFGPQKAYAIYPKVFLSEWRKKKEVGHWNGGMHSKVHARGLMPDYLLVTCWHHVKNAEPAVTVMLRRVGKVMVM